MSHPTGWQDGVVIFSLTKDELQRAVSSGDVIQLSVLGGPIAGTHSVKPSPVSAAGYAPPVGAVAFEAEFLDAGTTAEVLRYYPSGRVYCVVDVVPVNPPGPFAGSLRGGINPA